MPPTSRATVVLPVPGVADEDQVPRDGRRLQARLGAQGVDLQHRHLTVDLRLDLGQPDQGVQLGQQLLEALRRWLRLLPFGRLRARFSHALPDVP